MGESFYYIYERIKKVLCKLLLLCLLLVEPSLFAQGLELSYASWTFIGLPLGREIKLSPPLYIRNTGELEREFQFRVLPHSADYYTPFPCLSCIKLPGRLLIMPGERVELPVFVELPRIPSFFNQHWTFLLEVESVASEWEPISISGVVTMRIETEAGYIYEQGVSVAPSVINLTPADTSFIFWVANLTFLPETLQLALSPHRRADFIDRTAGYNRTVAFVRLEKENLVVRAGERLQVRGYVELPPTYAGDPLEALILIEEKRRDRREFIRVLLK